MSHQTLKTAWDIDVRPVGLKLVLVFMADTMNAKTGLLNPSVPHVAKKCGMSTKQARRYIHALIKAGFLSVVGNESGGFHSLASRRYALNLSAKAGDIDVDHDVETPAECAEPLPPMGGVSKPRPLPWVSQTPPMDVPNPSHGWEPNKKEQVLTGIEAQASPAVSAKGRKRKTAGQTFEQWQAVVGEQLTGDKHPPVVAYAEKVGIPLEWIELGWHAFVQDHQGRADKLQADWLATFAVYIRKGWLDIWKAKKGGGYFLTTRGSMLATETGIDAPSEAGEGGAASGYKSFLGGAAL